MRKFIAIIIGVVSVFFMFTVKVNAEEVKYGNLITDETSIEKDFILLNMDINEYYQPSYNYEKWYVIGMSEAYIDTETYDIQTYFYIYNPISPYAYEYTYTEEDDDDELQNKIECFALTYTLSSRKESSFNADVLSINYEHHIFKVKGFTYSYQERAEISISKIRNVLTNNDGTRTSDSTFKATVVHSKLNGFTVELNFNTTLIIDEYTVVEVEVNQDDNFINNWNSFWSWKEASLLVYFYNFNFPKHIEYDSVEYAKFAYNYNTYWEKIYVKNGDPYDVIGSYIPDEDYAEFNQKKLLNTEKVISEYNNTSKTIRVNNDSQTLTFPTFYLGNRVDNKQFGTWDVSFASKDFDYDCSVLLDSTYKTVQRDMDWPKPLHRIMYEDTNYTTLDKVELLELHYKNEGILYKCQVVSKPLENEDFDKVETKPIPSPSTPTDMEWWQIFLLWIGENTIHFFNPNVYCPDVLYMILGGVELLFALIVFISLLPTIIGLLISPIKLVFKLIFK